MKNVMAVCAMLAVLALAAEAQAGAKEKANKTKCSNKLNAIADQGMEALARPARALIPTILHLRDIGQDDAAWQLTENGVAQTSHNGHVTVLKLQETADQCVAKMERDGDSKEDILAVRVLTKTLILQVTVATKRAADSFFDIWTEIS